MTIQHSLHVSTFTRVQVTSLLIQFAYFEQCFSHCSFIDNPVTRQPISTGHGTLLIARCLFSQNKAGDCRRIKLFAEYFEENVT